MNIVIISDNFPYGGASANLLRLFAVGLAKQNVSVEVIMPHGNSFGDKNDHNKSRSGVIEGVPYKHLGFINHPRNISGKLAAKLIGYILPLLYLIKISWNRKLDIIVGYNTTFITTMTLIILKNILRKKMVIILPEFFEYPQGVDKTKLEIYKWYCFYLGIRYAVKFADGFIVLSTFLRDYLKDTLRITKPIIIMPNLTNPDIFDLGEVAPYIPGKTTIGFVGALGRKDGILDLIKSFSILNKRHPETHLLLIGDNLTLGSTAIPSHREYARSLGVDQSITFAGLLPYNQVSLLLNSCQILVLTRPKGVFAEAGFPTKLGEYFACRKPVVITKVGDIPKYFKDEEDVILVEPDNVESIVDGFERILDNPGLQVKLSANGYSWMAENLNYTKVTPKIADFFSLIS